MLRAERFELGGTRSGHGDDTRILQQNARQGEPDAPEADGSVSGHSVQGVLDNLDAPVTRTTGGGIGAGGAGDSERRSRRAIAENGFASLGAERRVKFSCLPKMSAVLAHLARATRTRAAARPQRVAAKSAWVAQRRWNGTSSNQARPRFELLHAL